MTKKQLTEKKPTNLVTLDNAENLVQQIKEQQEAAKEALKAAKEALKAAKQAAKYTKVDSIRDAVNGLKSFTYLEVCNKANELRTGKQLPVNHKAFDVYKYTIAGLIAFNIIEPDTKGSVSPGSKVIYTLIEKSEKAQKQA